MALYQRPVIQTYSRIPQQVQAVELTWENWSAICEFVDVPKNGYGLEFCLPQLRMMVYTTDHEGVPEPSIAREGDFIVKSQDGSLQVWEADAFHRTFSQ